MAAEPDHAENTHRATRRRGRPRRITLDDVIEVARRLPLDELTVRAVADELGVSRAAVYRYVDSADKLRRLRASASVSRLDFDPTAHEDSWPDWLEAFARSMRHWRLDNPEAASYLRMSSPDVVAAGILEALEVGVRRLLVGGFDQDEAIRALHFVVGMVWINTQDELMMRRSPDGRHPQASELLQLEPDALERLPHLDEALAADAQPWAGDERFDHELRWAILGLLSDHPIG